MFRLIIFILSFLSITLGVFFLLTRVVVVFIHEPTQEKIYSKLDQLHKKIVELQNPVLSRPLNFLKTVASAMTAALNSIFGPKIISVQSITVSICYALGALSCGMVLMIRCGGGYWDRDAIFSAVSYFVFGSFPIAFKSVFKTEERGLTVWLTALITMTICQAMVPLLWALKVFYSQSMLSFILLGIVVFLLGLLFYAFSINLIRWTLARISSTDSLLKMAGYSILNLLPIVILGGFFKFSLFVLEHTPSAPGQGPEAFKAAWANWGTKANVFVVFVLLALVLFGFFFVVSAFLFLILSVFLVVHRLTWPALRELLYAAQRYKVLSEGKVLIYLGVLFLGLGLGKYEWFTKAISKIFGL